MKEENPKDNFKDKEYSIPENTSVFLVKEPETGYETRTISHSFEKESYIPEGFMSSEEFRRKVKVELTQLYKQHGLI
jgi:hypothetical protein